MILARSTLDKGDQELKKNVSDKDLHVLISGYNITYLGWFINLQQNSYRSNTGDRMLTTRLRERQTT